MNNFNWDPEELRLWVAITLLSLLGRLVFHIQQVRKGIRTMWSFDLLLEIPIGLAMAFVTRGVCLHYGLGEVESYALAVVIGQQGPRLFDLVTDSLLSKLPSAKK